MGGGRRRFLADRAPLLGSSGQRLGLSASRFARRCGATVFFSRRNARPTQLRRLSHHGQKPAGAKALVSSSISRRSSSGGFETVRITFTGSDALTRAVSGITEAWHTWVSSTNVPGCCSTV
jgi:hypothetical protein